MERRRFLRHSVAAAVLGLTGRGALAAGVVDGAIHPPHTPFRPFSLATVPYDTPEKMSRKIQMFHDLPKLTRHWRVITARFRGYDRLGQMRAVNGFVNRVPYVTDDQLFHKIDWWSDPVHFFGAGGDCEEYALAKYAMLRHLGFHPARMDLVALLRRSDGEGHAVLAVRLDGRTYILDQLHQDPVPEETFIGYDLVYTLGDEGVRVPA